MLEPLPSPRNCRDTDDILYEIVRAQGNHPLAAERLGMSVEDMLAAVVADPVAANALTEKLRTLALIELFKATASVQYVVLQTLHLLPPKEVVKLYGNLLEALHNFTDSKTSTQNINVHETVIKLLPPEIREAMEVLVGGQGFGNNVDNMAFGRIKALDQSE